MSDSAEDAAGLQVPARVVPVPSSVSPEAQAYLAMGPMPSPDYPPLDDLEAWRSMIATTDEMVLSIFVRNGLMTPEGFDVETISVDGISVYVITPTDLDPTDTRVYLELHGGAFIVGGGELCKGNGTMTARKLAMRVWAVDYRMPPDHPYPAAVDDCFAVYRTLLRERGPEEIVVGGVSAGGNLAAALALRARDEGVPMPAAAVLLTPGMDLTQSGDTWQTNFGVDTVLTKRDRSTLDLYAGGHDLRDPYVSPIYADFSTGFPPSLLGSGTRDVLLSDTARMHAALRAAGVDAELHVLEAAPHGFFRGATPEDHHLDRQVRRFIDEHCPARLPTS
jgi:monoterpene epsilon-lactone hydrolase